MWFNCRLADLGEMGVRGVTHDAVVVVATTHTGGLFVIALLKHQVSRIVYRVKPKSIDSIVGIVNLNPKPRLRVQGP